MQYFRRHINCCFFTHETKAFFFMSSLVIQKAVVDNDNFTSRYLTDITSGSQLDAGSSDCEPVGCSKPLAPICHAMEPVVQLQPLFAFSLPFLGVPVLPWQTIQFRKISQGSLHLVLRGNGLVGMMRGLDTRKRSEACLLVSRAHSMFCQLVPFLSTAGR